MTLKCTWLWVSVKYSYVCRNIANTIMTNEIQFFRKIYLSHFIRNGTKGLCVRCELETEQNCNILTPSSSGYSSTSFSFSWAAQPGATRAQLSVWSWFSLLRTAATDSKLQTNWTSCCTGLYHCLTATCFPWASHLHRIKLVHGQGYTQISSTACTCSLDDGWVNMLHFQVCWYQECWVLLHCHYSLTMSDAVKTALVKVSDRSRGRLEGSLLSSNYSEVWGWALRLSLDCSTLPLIVTYNAEC